MNLTSPAERRALGRHIKTLKGDRERIRRARDELMKAARTADVLYMPEAHQRLMFSIDAIDDAIACFHAKQWTVEQEMNQNGAEGGSGNGVSDPPPGAAAPLSFDSERDLAEQRQDEADDLNQLLREEGR